MPAEERGRGTLEGSQGRIVGHGAGPHPTIGTAGFMSLFLVRTRTEWVVCMTEGAGRYNWKEARKGLGVEIPGEQFAPFAQQGLSSRVPFEEVKGVMAKSFPDLKFEWWEEPK